MLEAGTGDVAAWLEGQADMATVEWGEVAIRYRLEQAAGIWILREGAVAPEVLPGRLGGGRDGGEQ